MQKKKKLPNMLKIRKNSNIVMTREPSGSNSDIIHKFKVYIPIIFLLKMIGIFGLFIHKLSKHMLTLNSESNIPELCCEQCCLQGDWKTNVFFLSLSDILWAFSIYTSKQCMIGVSLSSSCIVKSAGPITNSAQRPTRVHHGSDNRAATDR